MGIFSLSSNDDLQTIFQNVFSFMETVVIWFTVTWNLPTTSSSTKYLNRENKGRGTGCQFSWSRIKTWLSCKFREPEREVICVHGTTIALAFGQLICEIILLLCRVCKNRHYLFAAKKSYYEHIIQQCNYLMSSLYVREWNWCIIDVVFIDITMKV